MRVGTDTLSLFLVKTAIFAYRNATELLEYTDLFDEGNWSAYAAITTGYFK